MPIKGDTALSSFSGKELAESSAIHGDFNQASINYSGHQNLEVRGAESFGAEDLAYCPRCGLNPNDNQPLEQQHDESDHVKEYGVCNYCMEELIDEGGEEVALQFDEGTFSFNGESFGAEDMDGSVVNIVGVEDKVYVTIRFPDTNEHYGYDKIFVGEMEDVMLAESFGAEMKDSHLTVSQRVLRAIHDQYPALYEDIEEGTQFPPEELEDTGDYDDAVDIAETMQLVRLLSADIRNASEPIREFYDITKTYPRGVENEMYAESFGADSQPIYERKYRQIVVDDNFKNKLKTLESLIKSLNEAIHKKGEGSFDVVETEALRRAVSEVYFARDILMGGYWESESFGADAEEYTVVMSGFLTDDGSGEKEFTGTEQELKDMFYDFMMEDRFDKLLWETDGDEMHQLYMYHNILQSWV